MHRTKKSTIAALRKSVRMKQQSVKVVVALPAEIVRNAYIVSGFGDNLYISPYSSMPVALYQNMRRRLRSMGYETTETENAHIYMNIKLEHPENGHEINIHLDRPSDTVQCEHLVTGVRTKKVYEWVCPDDPDFEERKALSVRLSKALE